MSGTLAIWYEPDPAYKELAPEGAPATSGVSVEVPATKFVEGPNLELHVNLWRDLASKAEF